ncbi:MAG: Trp biosynthesis-associated membrane protein [Microbacteriaceae bacterium]|nr:Trp biosynthesis-associated membrane protein [Microbacteriaceae bacterium]
MDLWLAIALPVVIAAFLAWYLWSSAKRKRRAASPGEQRRGDPRDAWDALSHGEDPTEDPTVDPTDTGRSEDPSGPDRSH